MNSQQFLNTVLMVSIFVLVFSVWTVCILFWMIQYARRRKRLKQRLGVGLDADARATDMLQLWRDEYQSRRGHVAPHKKETLGQRLARLFHEAGWKTPVGVLLFGVVAVAALAGVLVLVLGFGVWVGATVFCGVLAVFWFVTKQRVNSRIARFERQFVESLGIAARALRAGHPLVGAFQAIAEEIPEPVGVIFGEICQGQALGMDLRDSIRQIADRANSTDLKLFATAVSIQMTSGGNLADVMDSLAAVVRVRTRLSRKIRVLTASSRMNRNTLLAVPILLFVFMNISSPDYVEVMYNTVVGKVLLAVTVVNMVLGAWVMARLSKLKY